jgi:ATP-dependent DNA helicase RecQ
VAPAEVEAALACVARFEGHLGATRIAAILRGQLDAWTTSKRWVQDLGFFGALRDWDPERIRDLVNTLVELGLAARSHGEKPTLSVTPTGLAVLAGEQSLTVELEVGPPRAAPPRPRPVKGRGGGRLTAGELTDEALVRFDALRTWRLEIARKAEMPPYVIFHDKTLAEIARTRPVTIAALAAVPGVGPAKLERYGVDLLAVIGES